MRPLRFKVGDKVKVRRPIVTKAVTIYPDEIITIIHVNRLMRCYDVETSSGINISECSDDDFV